MTGSRDTAPSTFRALHRLVEHYTPDGALGRTLLGAPALSVAPFLFFGSIGTLGSATTLVGFLLTLLGTVLGVPMFLLGLFTLWPVYLLLIGNIESTEAYPKGATKPGKARETPEEVLKRRYAAGELTREEFERRLNEVMDSTERGSAKAESARDDRARFETSTGR